LSDPRHQKHSRAADYQIGNSYDKYRELSLPKLSQSPNRKNINKLVFGNHAEDNTCSILKQFNKAQECNQNFNDKYKKNSSSFKTPMQ